MSKYFENILPEEEKETFGIEAEKEVNNEEEVIDEEASKNDIPEADIFPGIKTIKKVSNKRFIIDLEKNLNMYSAGELANLSQTILRAMTEKSKAKTASRRMEQGRYKIETRKSVK